MRCDGGTTRGDGGGNCGIIKCSISTSSDGITFSAKRAPKRKYTNYLNVSENDTTMVTLLIGDRR